MNPVRLKLKKKRRKMKYTYILSSEEMNDLKEIRDYVQNEYCMTLFGLCRPVTNRKEVYFEKINRVIREAEKNMIEEGK